LIFSFSEFENDFVNPLLGCFGAEHFLRLCVAVSSVGITSLFCNGHCILLQLARTINSGSIMVVAAFNKTSPLSASFDHLVQILHSDTARIDKLW
jgi:hypothetical protein